MLNSFLEEETNNYTDNNTTSKNENKCCLVRSLYYAFSTLFFCSNRQ